MEVSKLQSDVKSKENTFKDLSDKQARNHVSSFIGCTCKPTVSERNVKQRCENHTFERLAVNHLRVGVRQSRPLSKRPVTDHLMTGW